MRINPTEAIEHALDNVSKKEANIAEELAKLPRSAEEYTSLELTDRLKAARGLLSRFANVGTVNSLPYEKAQVIEAELEGYEDKVIECHVGYQPVKTSSGYGDASYIQQHEAIGVMLIVNSLVSPPIKEKTNLGKLIFDWHYEEGEVVEEIDMESNLQDKRPLDLDLDQEFITIVDEACVNIIEGKLAEQRSSLGAAALQCAP